jgi:hypothetical protein
MIIMEIPYLIIKSFEQLRNLKKGLSPIQDQNKPYMSLKAKNPSRDAL